MAEKEYQRLTRARLRRAGFFTAVATRSSLWLGKDHLLCIDSNGYGEDYKRFYFRDIQTITLRQTRRRRWWNVALSPFALGLTTLFIATIPGTSPSSWSSNEIIGGAVLGSAALFFLLLLVLNTLRGPTCVCQLRTAVQEEELPSLNRLRRARKTLDRLRPLIETTQGSLSPEEIQSLLAQFTSLDAPPVIGRSTVQSPNTIRPYNGKAHLILFWLLLADLPVTALYVLLQSDWFDAAALLLFLITVGFAIVSLVKQRNTGLPSALKNITWTAVGCAALYLIASGAYGIYLAATNSRGDFFTDPVEMVMTTISTLVSVTLGAFGLIRLRRFRAASSPRTDQPPVITGPSTA